MFVDNFMVFFLYNNIKLNFYFHHKLIIMQIRNSLLVTFILGITSSIFCQHLTLKVLKKPVEIYKDPWGISHIYAENEHDLFVAQGTNMI